MFTPELAKFYTKFRASDAGKNFELVFVSSDRSAADFDLYFDDMPWLALPFADRKLKNDLSRKFKVRGIPTLVIVGPDGKTITTEGREKVATDPDGARFPWVPRPLTEELKGRFVDAEGREYDMSEFKDADYLGIYFSASWCPPCQVATPKLVEFYKKVKAEGKSFDLVLSSACRDEASYKTYLAKMPWKAIPFGDTRSDALASALKVSGIPMLAIIEKATGKVVNRNALGDVTEDAALAHFPWLEPAVKNLTGSSASALSEGPCLVVYYDDETAAVEAYKKAGAELKEKFAKHSDDELAMFAVKKGDEFGERLMQLCGVTSSPALFIANLPDRCVLAPKHARADITVENITAFLDAFAKDPNSLSVTLLGDVGDDDDSDVDD